MRIWDINPADGTVIDPAGREAPLDPMRQTPRIPAGATNIEPPETSERQAARWTGEGWESVPDWRGHVYWLADGSRQEIARLGIEPPDNALDEAPPIDEPEPVFRTFKTDVWQRATEDEAEIIDGALITSPVRMRRMWDDCQIIEHESELFADLYAAMADAFGEERADELLAPSEGA